MNATEYDARADEWWPPRGDFVVLYRLNAARFGWFDRYVPDWVGQKVLDVGCGGGYTAEHLARRGAIVTGPDISPGPPEVARRHAEGEGLAIDYRLGTPSRLPVEDGAFDVATCFDVIEHVEDLGTLLAQIHRSLRTGGLFLFDTMNRSLWAWIAMILLGERVLRVLPRGTHDWSRFVAPRDLAALLATLGFGEVEMAGIRPVLPARGELPFRVTDRGSRAVLYFGAAAP